LTYELLPPSVVMLRIPTPHAKVPKRVLIFLFLFVICKN